jgi:multiple sugar transport system permease protein
MAIVEQRVDTSSRTGVFKGLKEEWKRARKEGWGNPFGYLFIAPALILYLIFNVYPIFRGFIMAFTDFRFSIPKTRWDFNGIANFVEMFQDKYNINGLIVVLKYAVVVVPGTLVIALFLAVMISKVRHWSGFYRWVVYLPVILPTAVTVLMWKQVFNYKFGFLDQNLRLLGMARPPDWLGTVRYALTAVSIIDIWRGIGFPTLIFLITIYSINREIYEAAEIDGANGWNQFWRITLPLLKPAFALILVLNSGFLGATESMLLLTNGGPQNSTLTIGLHLYQVGFTLGDLRMGYASSVSLVLGIIAALISLGWFSVLRDRS